MPIDLDITLDRSSPIPLYFQVAEQLESAVTSGKLAPGTKISDEVTLSTALGVSRPTMRQAIQLLVDKGMLVRKRGVGTQVVQGKINRSVELTSLHDDLSAAGKQHTTTVLDVSLQPAPDLVAEHLDLKPDAQVWHLHRLRFVDDEPLALMQNYLPESTVDLSAFDLSTTGLYQALRRSGIHLRVARQHIGARPATTEEARLLNTRKNAAMLTMSRTAYSDAGTAIEYGSHLYRADLYTFEITLVER
ncbi:GntR family transcriptional regulator [Amycolatopsis sp. CA-161197]|uniref:GntR family transcriptional regulator n=1 Tax=Amycolatopsis sp. CA-161197 TaxID=3239922 RepID=UPI003D8D6ABF